MKQSLSEYKSIKKWIKRSHNQYKCVISLWLFQVCKWRTASDNLSQMLIPPSYRSMTNGLSQSLNQDNDEKSYKIDKISKKCQQVNFFYSMKFFWRRQNPLHPFRLLIKWDMLARDLIYCSRINQIY